MTKSIVATPFIKPDAIIAVEDLSGANKSASKQIIHQWYRLLLLTYLHKIIVDRRISEITTNAIKEINEKYPQEENPLITEEMISFFSDKVAKEFVLSFQHRFKRQN